MVKPHPTVPAPSSQLPRHALLLVPIPEAGGLVSLQKPSIFLAPYALTSLAGDRQIDSLEAFCEPLYRQQEGATSYSELLV